MNHNELLKRVETLDTSTIVGMSHDVLAMLTDNFKEQLVRALIIRGITNHQQRKIITAIKTSYKRWKKENDTFWGALPQLEQYPDYMEKWQLDIECGWVITADGCMPKTQPQKQFDSWTPSLLGLVQRNINNTIDNNDSPAKVNKNQLEEAGKRIKKLEASEKQLKKENSKLKEQIKKSSGSSNSHELNQQSELLAEKEETIKQMQSLIDDYASRFDPDDIKRRKVKPMTGKQHVIFLLAILAHHNRIPYARTNLSYLLSFIASRNESTMFDYLKESISKRECEKLAIEFDEKAPFLGQLIRELPDKLKENISEKNKQKATKKNDD